jgi:hypothetical protein
MQFGIGVNTGREVCSTPGRECAGPACIGQRRLAVAAEMQRQQAARLVGIVAGAVQLHGARRHRERPLRAFLARTPGTHGPPMSRQFIRGKWTRLLPSPAMKSVIRSTNRAFASGPASR